MSKPDEKNLERLSRLAAYVRHPTDDALPNAVRIEIFELLQGLYQDELNKQGRGRPAVSIRAVQASMIYQIRSMAPDTILKEAAGIALELTGETEKARATVIRKYQDMNHEGAFENVHIGPGLSSDLLNKLRPRKK
jgi:hypothetical protein